MGLSFISGLDIIAVVCIIAGLAFVIFEMNIPGFGLPGIVGVLLLVAGVILYAETPLQALVLILIIIAILGLVLAIVYRSASKGKLSKNIVLTDSLGEDIPFSAADDLGYLIGSEGVTLTPLRPSGTADFSGVKLDVISNGEFIKKGSTVIVDKVRGNIIIVKQIKKG
jgi:membrane-bound ClpP family serine protease